MVDFSLNSTQEQLVGLAREFGHDVLHDAEKKIDRISDPDDAAKSGLFWGALGQAFALGFNRMAIARGTRRPRARSANHGNGLGGTRAMGARLCGVAHGRRRGAAAGVVPCARHPGSGGPLRDTLPRGPHRTADHCVVQQ